MNTRSRITTALVVALLVLVGLAGPWFAPADPLQQNLRDALRGPSWSHWLGTDYLGRDQLSRLLGAARVSLTAVVVVLGVALIVGVAIGVLAGWSGGIIDRLCMRLADVVLTVPVIVLALVVLAWLGPSFTNLLVALGATWWPPYARLVRTEIYVRRHSPMVESLTLLGAPRTRIIGKHMLPASLTPTLTLLSTDAGAVILAVATLSFLGLGIAPPHPEWGVMLTDARPYLRSAPWLLAAPAVALTAVVIISNIVAERMGEGLRLGGAGRRGGVLGRLIGVGAPLTSTRLATREQAS